MNRVIQAHQSFLVATTSTLVPGINPEVREVTTTKGQRTSIHELMLLASQKIISVVQKEGETYMLHSKEHQGEIN